MQKAEKVASFLTFAFDNVLSRFYSERDFENKFTLLSSDIKEEERETLMRLEICALEAFEGRFGTYEQIVNALFELIKLCRGKSKSCYVIDRPKLRGKVEACGSKNRVLIMEKDEALSLLLETLCSLNSLDVRVCRDYGDFFKIYDDFAPDVVLLDWGDSDKKSGVEISKRLKKNPENAPRVIFSSSVHNKKEILAAGADFYLPKPYEADVAIRWIKKFLF